jgi:hypothetical protein
LGRGVWSLPLLKAEKPVFTTSFPDPCLYDVLFNMMVPMVYVDFVLTMGPGAQIFFVMMSILGLRFICILSSSRGWDQNF